MKKWGKIGAPHSQKRKNWLRRMRSARKGIVLKRKGKGKRAKRGIVLKRKVSPKRKKRSKR